MTWTPASGPQSRVPLLSRALASALDTIAPAAVELAAAGAWRLLERRPGARTALPAARRALRAAARELPGARQER
jgi:hypothetical protein